MTYNSIQSISHLIHPLRLKETVKQWLLEDTPNFDYGGFVVGEREGSAFLLCKGEGVLSGVPFFTHIFNELNCSTEWFYQEGTLLKPPCITRSSGIASCARRLKQKKMDVNWHGEIAGTRKTTPGFRMVEKYSLLVGGVSTHRYDLSSMIMLKDNHIWTAGNVTQVIKCYLN